QECALHRPLRAPLAGEARDRLGHHGPHERRDEGQPGSDQLERRGITHGAPWGPMARPMPAMGRRYIPRSVPVAQGEDAYRAMQAGAVRVLRPAPGPAGARARECGKIAAATSPALPGTVRASPRRSCTPRTPLESRRELEAAIPLGTRARLGLHLIATKMKIGAQFENVLQRGLLEFALGLPNGAPEFRYVYHEVIEEGQHSLMFQEFVTRTGFDVPGLGFWDRLGARRVLVAARHFPALFFIFVLGGEDPIDHVQRTELVSGRPLHPLPERIMRIHVTEEARHPSFARHYLRAHVPRLSPAARTSLALQAPLILGPMAQLMMRPSAEIVGTYDIPKEVVAEAYTRNRRHRAKTVEALGKVRDLCREIGIVTRWSLPLWQRMGIWEN